MPEQYLVPEMPERLIVIDFWDHDIPWHMRMLLQNTGALGVWIVSSADMEVARLDLNEHRGVMLQGGAAVPPDYAGQYSYCFDSPIDPVELAHIRAESREMLTLLGLSRSDDRRGHVARGLQSARPLPRISRSMPTGGPRGVMPT